MLISNVGPPPTLVFFLVAIGILAVGILSFCSGFFNWDREEEWPATAFWNSILGQKWARRLCMLLGVVITIVGVFVFISALRLWSVTGN